MADILFIDNFDSFSYNLVDEFLLKQHVVTVIRNDIPLETMVELAYRNDMTVISPGPGNPEQAGHCKALLELLSQNKPVLGICLGHQLIVEAFNGVVEVLDQPIHGQSSLIDHKNDEIFSGIANPFKAGRYHSLVATKVPQCLEVIATTDNQVMAVKHKTQKLVGLQFHPESILTTQGSVLLENCIHYLLKEAA